MGDLGPLIRFAHSTVCNSRECPDKGTLKNHFAHLLPKADEIGAKSPRAKIFKEDIKETARLYKVLEFIASFAGGNPTDFSPFDKRILEAYVVGNEYTEKIPLTDLTKFMEHLFPYLGVTLPKTARMHHSLMALIYHLDILGKDIEEASSCMIIPARIIGFSTTGDKNDLVLFKPQIRLIGGELQIGGVKELIINLRHTKMNIKAGQSVALHFDIPFQVLSPHQVNDLSFYNLLAMETVNEIQFNKK